MCQQRSLLIYTYQRLPGNSHFYVGLLGYLIILNLI